MNRRRFILASAAAASWQAAPSWAQARPASRIPRIAYVWLFDVGPSAPYQSSFRARMNELGWVEGKTLQAEYRSADGDPESGETNGRRWAAEDVFHCVPLSFCVLVRNGCGRMENPPLADGQPRCFRGAGVVSVGTFPPRCRRCRCSACS